MEFIPNHSDQLKKLLEENLVYNQDIYRKVDKLYKHMIWQRVISWIYFAMIILPIIASLFFLPALIRGLTSLIDPSGSLQLDKIIIPSKSPTASPTGSTTDLLKQYQQLLKEIQR